MNYLIDFKDDASVASIDVYLNANDCEVVKIYDNFNKTYLVSSVTEPSSNIIIESIVNDDDAPIQLLGEIIPINQYYLLPNPNLPQITVSTADEKDWWKNYVLLAPEFDKPSIEVTRKGALSAVYIMDSGIDADHPEFAEANIANLFSFTGEFSDTNGHGTALASVISGKTCGLSSAQLKIVKIFDKSQTTKQSDLLNAFDAILSDFLGSNTGPAFINCSWSIAKNAYIEQKIQLLLDAGVGLVASAGNSGLPITDVTPASMQKVLTIGSFNKDLTPSDFSNYTDPSVISNTESSTNHGSLDGWAPGENIWVATPGGTYGYAAGTSIAAAIHSCVLAYNVDSHSLQQTSLAGLILNYETLFSASLGRRDLLDLSNPKYINSSNTVSTLTNKVTLPAAVPLMFQGLIRVGETKIIRVFNIQNTTQVEILTPLPEGFSILPSGHVRMQPLNVVGDYEIVEFKILVTLADETTVECPISMTVISETFDVTTVPADDPDVNVFLEIAHSCFGGGSFTASASCYDDCGGGHQIWSDWWEGMTCSISSGPKPGGITCGCTGGYIVPSSCFVAGSLVLMADGSQQPIETISIGDFVISANGPVRVNHIDYPTLGARKLIAFDNGLCKTSHEHTMWIRDTNGEQWWSTRSMYQLLVELSAGEGPYYNGHLPVDLTDRYAEAIDFAHIDGWKTHTTIEIPASMGTQLYHLIVDDVGQSYFVDGYMVGSAADVNKFDWENFNWTGLKAS